MRTLALSLLLAAVSVTATAAEHSIEAYRYAGPYAVSAPVSIDTLDVNGHAFDAKSLVDAPTRLEAVRQGDVWQGGAEALPVQPAGQGRYALHMLGFTLTNQSYTRVTLSAAKAPANYRLFLDGQPSQVGELPLEPGTHRLVLKYLSDAEASAPDSLRLTYTTPDDGAAVHCGLDNDEPQLYTVDRMMQSHLNFGPQLSPKGDYLLVTEYQRAPQQATYWYYLVERATGRRTRLAEYYSWMPRTNRYYATRQGREGRELYSVDPATGSEQILATHLPEGSFTWSPDEQFLVFTDAADGPKELNRDVFEVLNPEDRQPGWRNRSTLSLYDLSTGLKRPLTFGYSSCWLSDISQDGRYLLLGKSEHCYRPLGEEQSVDRPLRPHEWTSYFRLDLQTMAVDTLIHHDGFLASVGFSPDGTQLLLSGSPEAFDRKGCTLPAEVIPSMYDYQAYLFDIASREVRPLTRQFDPSVSHLEWSTADGQIYFTAENRDSVSLYRLEPSTGNIRQLALPEENVRGFSLATCAPVLSFCGQSAMNSDRLYTVDLSRAKVPGRQPSSPLQVDARCFESLSDLNLRDVEVAQCRTWTFRNSVGDEVLCRYYLPVGLSDEQGNLVSNRPSVAVPADGTVPMITYYYGGCSPTARSFESSYPWQCWAALGYAVLVVQPSGAAGFGQEWASRHVNTAGVDPARDITEAVREFTRTHAYINKEKIGCCGASYGGFMTQYMLTLPDCPFACAISHAGISDHTTYWGYGYWGYSYSEVSMANSYPWSETDLYVQNSPIYNVDKITTPILFLHGTKDVNVPINNSIQMFTALKLLGRQTALVCVEGEDHGVAEYSKRLSWLKTQLAWFQKYLKDDSSWWNALYPRKEL